LWAPHATGARAEASVTTEPTDLPDRPTQFETGFTLLPERSVLTAVWQAPVVLIP
jgi:hypothetical protein